jgi:PmbA protein
VGTTGNAIRGGYAGSPSAGCLALQLVPGKRAQADLISSIDDGVLIEGVSGLHSGVNTVSGDFSVGATGMTIRNGALAEPVREFTIASTIQRMLNDIIEVGADLEWLPMRASGPSIVIRDVMVSGSS